MLAALTQLGELRASGVLTEAEFDVQKARTLSA
jgi:putative oligomerization/nucleic acid binding protein